MHHIQLQGALEASEANQLACRGYHWGEKRWIFPNRSCPSRWRRCRGYLSCHPKKEGRSIRFAATSILAMFGLVEEFILPTWSIMPG